jgi:hypothetical protein
MHLQKIKCKSHCDTSAPLGIGASYASTAKVCLEYRNLRGTVKTDQNGTLYIYNMPTSAVEDDVTTINVVANVGVGFVVRLAGQYVKVRYTNGGVAQTFFRLQAFVEP